MLYVRVTRFDGSNAVCETDMGRDVRIIRELLPEDVRIGDAFKVRLPLTSAEDIEPIEYQKFRYWANIGIRLRRKRLRFDRIKDETE